MKEQDLSKVVEVMKVTPLEMAIIYELRKLQFGKLSIQVQHGKPFRLEINKSELITETEMLDEQKIRERSEALFNPPN